MSDSEFYLYHAAIAEVEIVIGQVDTHIKKVSGNCLLIFTLSSTAPIRTTISVFQKWPSSHQHNSICHGLIVFMLSDAL